MIDTRSRDVFRGYSWGTGMSRLAFPPIFCLAGVPQDSKLLLTAMFQGHGRGRLFIMPHLDIRHPSILCARGYIEVCGKGGLVDDRCDGTKDNSWTGSGSITNSRRSYSPSSVPCVYGRRFTDSVHIWRTLNPTRWRRDSRSEIKHVLLDLYSPIEDCIYLRTSLRRSNNSHQSCHRRLLPSTLQQTIPTSSHLLHPLSSHDLQHHVFFLPHVPMQSDQLPLDKIQRGWKRKLLERYHTLRRHLRPLCHVCNHRLVFWNPPNLLRLENADEPPYQALRHPHPLSRILVCPPSSLLF